MSEQILIKKRSHIKAKLTRFITFLNEWNENEEKRQQRAGTGRAKGEENSAKSKSGDLKGGKGRERENDPKTLSRLAFLGRRDDFRMIILSVARFFAKGTYYEPISRLKRLKRGLPPRD